MPLFRNTEPDLRALIAYIVARAREREITLTRTRLVKLLYLLDVERIRSRREPVTGVNWVFFHYGPYAFELIDTLEQMEGSELVAQSWRGSILYRAAPGAPDGEDWISATRRSVDSVIARYAALGTDELLDYVYFETGPMVEAERGEPLDMSLARDDQRPPAQPLEAPEPPADVEERLERWRAQTSRRLPTASLDPPGRLLEDHREDLGGVAGAENVRARLHVPDGNEL